MKHHLSLAILALAGCSMAAGQEVKIKGNLNSADAQFVREALASSQHEIEMGKMALKQSNDPQVKSLAQRLINDHTAAAKKLEEIAGAPSSASATVPATTAAIQADINSRSDELTAKNANSIDQAVRTGVGQSNAITGVATGPRTDVHSRTGDGHEDTYIETLMGASFDKAWAKQMVDDHLAAIGKFEAEQKEAKDPNLQSFIATTLPTLREHLAQAQALHQ